MASSTCRSRLLMVATAIIGIVAGCYLVFTSRRPDALPHEKQVTLTGHPVFHSDSSSLTPMLVATLDSDPLKRRFLWPQQALAAGELPAGKNLRYTFFETPHGPSMPLELARIEGDSGTLFDGSVCLVHRETMHRTLVRLLPPSGMISPTPSIEDLLFPHSGVIFAGPGMGSLEVPTWVCDTCHRERDRWLDKARRTASVSN